MDNSIVSNQNTLFSIFKSIADLCLDNLVDIHFLHSFSTPYLPEGNKNTNADLLKKHNLANLDTYHIINIQLTEFLKNYFINISYDFSITVLAVHIFIIASHCLQDRCDVKHQPSPVFDFACNFNNFNANNNVFKEDSQNPLVVNLSQHTLTPAQTKVLSRGLKFCPNPGHPDLSSYQADLDAFHLRLKRFLFFLKPKRNNQADQLDNTTYADLSQTNIDYDIIGPDEPFKHRKFKKPSAWVPPPIAPLEFFISKNNLDLAKCKPKKRGKSNISRDEQKALRELANNHNIIIKPADKGGAVVIQDRDKYVSEGLRQLSDRNFYEEKDSDLTKTHHEEVVNILDEMYRTRQIDRSCYLYLTDSNIRTAQFYTLPKIHKKKQNPPGRPIVSGNGCPTERISQFIDHFLQPSVKNIRSYIKDTTDFLLMLESLGQLPPNCILVTLDVASLYTNIPNKEGCTAALAGLDGIRGGATNPSNTHLIKLLEKVLRCNNFDFHGRHFLQVGGTAMGTKVAPAYANTFMGWFEENHVYTYHRQPLLWKRFIDDIFVIWQHDHRELDNFISYLNSRMPSIKFEAEKSLEQVSFLDVLVKLKGRKLETTLYTKPTDSHNYINYASCHQKSCRDGIPYGQFLRLKRICSTEEEFVRNSKSLAFYFHKADYPLDLIQKSFERAYAQDRQMLITPKSDTTIVDGEKKDGLFLITTHHPTFHEVNNIVTSNLDLLDRSSSTRPIVQTQITRGFRRCKNLRDILVRAKITPLPATNSKTATFANECKRTHCIYCRMLIRTGSIHCPQTDQSFITRRQVSCRCTNLIYALECRQCGKVYVGQTKRRLMDRIMEHLRNIRQRCQTHIVSRHYTRPDHDGIQNMVIHILEFIPAHPDSRAAADLRNRSERKWIFRLHSQVPNGLNISDI